uniref:Uncharacterized protein n=1 Tax=Photinus pyralis TaxID=7054 RepID=A0A1Y1MHV9_PHOPY
MDEYKSLNFYDILCRLLPELKTCDAKSFSSDIVPTLKTVISISHTMLSGAYNYYQVVEMANLADVTKIGEDQRSISPDDICNIQYSSVRFTGLVCYLNLNFSTGDNWETERNLFKSFADGE